MKLLKNNINLSSTKIKVFKNVSWSALGKVVEIINALVVGVFVARYLKPENYGILNYTVGYVGMFTLLSEFGITGILVRELSKKKSNHNILIGSAMGIRLFFSILTIVIIYFSLVLFEDDKNLRLFILIYSFNFIFLSFSMTLRNYFVSQIRNELIVKSEIFRATLLASTKVILILTESPLLGFIIATSIDSLVILTFFIFFYTKKYGSVFKFSIDLSVVRKLVRSSVPLFFEGIAAVLYQKIDLVMAGRLIDNEAVGYYAVALKFINFAIFIPMVLSQTLSPLLVQKLESCNYDTNNEEYIKYRRKIGDIIVYSGFIIAVGFFIVAGPVINILYGDDYADSVNILRILAWKGLFCGLGFTGSVIIITEGRERLVYLRNIIGGILNLALNFLLIPLFGINGVAMATIISFGVATYIANLFIKLYRNDFYLQTNFLFFGGIRLLKMGKDIIKHKGL